MLKGSCLCGNVQYEVTQLDSPIEHCSCQTCRKAHAAPFNSSATVLRDHFQWVAGEGLLSNYESSPGKIRHFCSVCGSHIVAEKPAQSYVILRVATLDEDPGQKPEFQIWKSHEVAWLEYGPQIMAHSEWEPGH